MDELHPVYPGGPNCQPNCPGPWSSYHDGYGDGFERGEVSGRLASAETLDVERLRAAIYTVSVAHDWANTTDTEDRTEEIAAEYTALAKSEAEA